MKLLLLGREKQQQVPPEYTVIKLTENNITELDSITDHSCEEIICEEVFENMPHKHFMEVLQRVFIKMRLNGHLLFTGIDLAALVEQYQINNIDDDYFNKLVYSKKCIIATKRIVDLAREFGINVVSLDKQGFIYKLVLSRLS
jgi:predicted SAM-dependent methyltransferase